MSAIPKKRLCWNCHGEVPMVVQTCPYCGVYVEQTAAGVHEVEEHEPPYSYNSQGGAIPASPFAIADETVQDSQSHSSGVAAVALNDAKSVLMPVAFLLAGSVFFLFGLVVALFAEEGTLTLSWNGEYWFAYLFGGIAFLLFGWRALQGIDG